VSLPPDPYAGLSAAQQQTLQQQQQSAYETKYKAWLSALDYEQMNLHSLPRVPLTASLDPGRASLHDAVAHADMIVVGTVSGFQPTPSSGTNVTMSVDRVLKGPSTPTITVNQAGGLHPSLDWSGVFILQSEGEALLLPGDRALLLLQRAPDGSLYIQGATGFYQIVNGTVQPGTVNQWGSTVKGLTEAAFLQQLTAAAQ